MKATCKGVKRTNSKGTWKQVKVTQYYIGADRKRHHITIGYTTLAVSHIDIMKDIIQMFLHDNILHESVYDLVLKSIDGESYGWNVEKMIMETEGL